jgi:hypothetical protein
MTQPHPRRCLLPRRRAWALVLVFISLVVASCDTLEPDAPGERLLAVVSPHGPEGAAVLRLSGGDVETITAVNGRLFVDRQGDELTAVVVLSAPGEVLLRLLVGSVRTLPAVTLLDVAAPDNSLRGDLASYSVEFRRPAP